MKAAICYEIVMLVARTLNIILKIQKIVERFYIKWNRCRGQASIFLQIKFFTMNKDHPNFHVWHALLYTTHNHLTIIISENWVNIEYLKEQGKVNRGKWIL